MILAFAFLAPIVNRRQLEGRWRGSVIRAFAFPAPIANRRQLEGRWRGSVIRAFFIPAPIATEPIRKHGLQIRASYGELGEAKSEPA